MDLSGQFIQYAPLEVDDFSGGITDNYLGGAINKYHNADNLLVEKYGAKGKLLVRPGSGIFDSARPFVDSAGVSRLTSLKYFGDYIVPFTKNKVYTQNNTGATWTSLVGPNGGNPPFSTAADGLHVVSLSTWQDHLFVASDTYEYISKIYKNSAGLFQIRTAGLPALASSPTLTTSSAGVSSYIYRFCYKYTYLVGTVQYIDRGSLTEVTVSTAATISTSGAMAIAAIPVLSNTANATLWDTTNIDVEVYRTTNGGVNFFLVKAVDNGTTSTTDTMTDATLQLQEPLYTEGEIVENDPVPKAKVVHIVEDTSTAYYGNIKDGTELKTSLVQQSVPGDPDSCPADFTAEIGDQVVGISSVQGLPVVCGLNSVYRLDGSFDIFGRGGMIPRKISDRADCVSSQSIVQTMFGIFWMGTEYVYYSDGYRVNPINLEWTETHKLFTDTAAKRKKIQGKYDRKNNRIWWTVQIGDNSSDNDACYVLNLNFGDFTKEGVFTTVSGGDPFRPTALEFVGDTMYRGDESSYLLLHEEGLLTDPVINTASDASTWATRAIIYNYESCSFNMGESSRRKVANRINIKARNESNLSLDIISINDDGRLTETLKPIRSRTNVSWGDEDVVWGDPDIIWNYQSLIVEQRRFPNKSFRFTDKQIKLTNAYTIITNSDLNGNANINSTLKTATTVNSANTFPSASVGYYMSFASDDYTAQYEILSINSSNNVLTLDDDNATLSTQASGPWLIKGYPKGESLGLLSYTMDYAIMGKTQNFYSRSSEGENA